MRVGICIRSRLAVCDLCASCDAFSGHCGFYAFRLDLEGGDVLLEKLRLLVLVLIEDLRDHISDLVAVHILDRDFDRVEVFAPVVVFIQYNNCFVVKIARTLGLDPDLDL